VVASRLLLVAKTSPSPSKQPLAKVAALNVSVVPEPQLGRDN
jgi:hypothetical protein